MKKGSIITAILALFMMTVPSQVSAQEGSGFTKFDVPKNLYANFPAGIHYMYIGEVVNAWKKSE